MYLYFCRLLPAIKQIILKKLPTWISLAFYCSHRCIFSPYLNGAARRSGRGFGLSSQTEGKTDLKKLSLILLFLTKPFCSHSFEQFMLSRESVKSPSTKLFVPQVLNGPPKPTEPPTRASGCRGRLRLARNRLRNTLMVLPYLTAQAHTLRAFVLKHS